MADTVKGPEPDNRVKSTDLTSETPTTYLGSPWRKEPAEPELAELSVRGRAAVMLVSVGSMFATLAGLHFVFQVPLYPALVIAIIVPLLYGGVDTEGRGKIRVGLNWWHRRQQR
jgi:hypothetical protein